MRHVLWVSEPGKCFIDARVDNYGLHYVLLGQSTSFTAKLHPPRCCALLQCRSLNGACQGPKVRKKAEIRDALALICTPLQNILELWEDSTDAEVWDCMGEIRQQANNVLRMIEPRTFACAGPSPSLLFFNLAMNI